jgi:hypothetical protein
MLAKEQINFETVSDKASHGILIARIRLPSPSVDVHRLVQWNNRSKLVTVPSEDIPGMKN